MELRLFQIEVAKRFGVSEDCITYWENNRSEPQVKYYPRIIEFLGYFPFEIDQSTIAGKIKTYRFMNGLSQKLFAKLVKVDPTTVRLWEEGKGRESMIKKFEWLLTSNDFVVTHSVATA